MLDVSGETTCSHCGQVLKYTISYPDVPMFIDYVIIPATCSCGRKFEIKHYLEPANTASSSGVCKDIW